VIHRHPVARDRAGMSAYPSQGDRGENWAAFAGIVFLVVGLFNIFDGIVALVNDDYFHADELLFGDLSMWGTIYLVLGAVQLLTAMLVFRGNIIGAFLGITLAVLNVVLVLLSLGAYPVWALIILALDGVVIYALTAHGDALRTAR
jgi:hypothetical protein